LIAFNISDIEWREIERSSAISFGASTDPKSDATRKSKAQ